MGRLDLTYFVVKSSFPSIAQQNQQSDTYFNYGRIKFYLLRSKYSFSENLEVKSTKNYFENTTHSFLPAYENTKEVVEFTLEK